MVFTCSEARLKRSALLRAMEGALAGEPGMPDPQVARSPRSGRSSFALQPSRGAGSCGLAVTEAP
jgi:hypothetical protein